MAIEKELDLKWYWLGYTCGANTRKEIKEMPNRITNLGDRGVQLIPTETQRVSFFIGVMHGRGKLVQNFDVVKLVQYQDKKKRSKSDWLTLGMTEIKGSQGTTVRMPLIISNNSVDNRGYIGFQAKISYPKTYLTFTNLIQANPNLTTLNYQHDAAAGIVLVQGLMDNISYSDAIQVYLEFYISPSCPSSQTIQMCGPSGTGQGSDILTLISNTLYYIQPLTLENGLIKMPDQQGQYEPTTLYTETLPPIGDSYDYYGGGSGGGTSLSYSFGLDLSYGGNVSGGSQGSASLGVQIVFGDGSYQTVYIPLQEGYHEYSGKIPLTLPSSKRGPIKIRIWVEGDDEEDLWYWFIKAGALWGFETEIDRADVGEYEETQEDKPKQFIEFLVLKDDAIIVIEGYSPVVSDIQIGEGFVLFDYNTYIRNRDWLFELFETLGISDDLIIDGAGVVIRDAKISDILQLLEGFDLRFVGEPRSIEGESLGIGDGVIIEIE